MLSYTGTRQRTGSFSAIFQFTLQPPQNIPGTQSQAAPGHSDTRHQRNWNRVWQLALAVMGSMLRTLRHGFLKEALDFAGVHRERLAEVCKHSIALKMAILGDLGEASRHEIFTDKITASIDHIKNGKTYSYGNSSRSIWIFLLLIGQKIFSGQSRFVDGIQIFLELVVSGGFPVLLVSFATTTPLMDSKNDNQCNNA